MLKGLFNRLETGKLLISGIALCVDPTGIAATALTADAALHFRDKLFKQNTGLDALAAEIDTDFNAELAKRSYDKPTDARKILPDMLTVAFEKAENFVRLDLDAARILAELTKHFRTSAAQPEHKNEAMIAAFERLYGPLLVTLCNDPRLKQALDPALYRDLRKETREQSQDIKELKAAMQDFLSGAGVPLEKMTGIASLFGEHTISDQKGLETFLTQKAEEHRNLKAEFANLAGLSTRIDNIRGAAEAALDDFDYDTANDLLENAHEIIRDQLAEPLRINATLAERQADIALIQNDPDRAFTLLMAAADGFTPLDPLEPSRKKRTYGDRLYAHGLRYGGNGLHFAIRMNRSAITDDLEHAEPYLWASCQNNLALSLTDQGARTYGPAGTDLLNQSVTAFRAALTVYTRDAHPVDWAMTQNNLAGALEIQGTRTDGPAGTDLLNQSVTAFRAALTVRTRDDHPVQWAMTQNNLAVALQTQGTRTDGPAGTDLLTQSVTAYRAALTVYTRDDHPVQWAMTQENLAIAEASHATHPATTDPRPHLDAALTYIDAALTVYDPIDMSYDHGTATATRDHILALITALD